MPSAGIVSVLSGAVDLEDAVFRPDNFGGHVLGGEVTQINAADLFASSSFRGFIRELRGKYDVVIIDTPPVLVVPDARIIAPSVDAVLFSVLWNSTSKAQVDEALRLFHNSNQRVSGLILSKINPKGMKRYGYGDRHGAYSEYGSSYYTD